MTPGLHSLDYLDHLARESARFSAALLEADADAPVPTCPGWDADDLLWHLADVQWFWGSIVNQRLQTTAETQALVRVERPAERDALRAFYARASKDLQDGLRSAAPETAVWTWSLDQSVGFIRRRQAHEALIHRIDAELTAGNRTPMHPQLSADGVDEVLRIMYGELPDGATSPSDRAPPASSRRTPATPGTSASGVKIQALRLNSSQHGAIGRIFDHLRIPALGKPESRDGPLSDRLLPG